MSILQNNTITTGNNINASDIITDSDYLYSVKDTTVIEGGNTYKISTQGTITKTVDPSGYGTISGDGSYTYSLSAQTKSFTATPSTGNKFSSWSTSVGSWSSSTTNPGVLTIPANTASNITVTCNFEALPLAPVTINVSGGNVTPVNGAGSGTLQLSFDGSTWYNATSGQTYILNNRTKQTWYATGSASVPRSYSSNDFYSWFPAASDTWGGWKSMTGSTINSGSHCYSTNITLVAEEGGGNVRIFVTLLASLGTSSQTMSCSNDDWYKQPTFTEPSHTSLDYYLPEMSASNKIYARVVGATGYKDNSTYVTAPFS